MTKTLICSCRMIYLEDYATVEALRERVLESDYNCAACWEIVEEYSDSDSDSSTGAVQ
jgi:hypothetical protein